MTIRVACCFRMLPLAILLCGACATTVASKRGPAESAHDQPQLAASMEPLEFLLGTWNATGDGTTGPSKGSFTFRPVAEGRGLIRESVNESAAGRHEDFMMVYTDATGALSASYIDNEGHLIHYAVSVPEPRKRAEFLSVEAPNSPRFQLVYEVDASNSLIITFAIQMPGTTELKPYVHGTARRQ